MEGWRKKCHQNYQQSDKNKENDEEISHMLYVPADYRFDNNAGAVEYPYNDQGNKLRFKKTYGLARGLLLHHAGKKGNREKKKAE